MSAPIDDLLYGGDDSGDEDDLSNVPMSSYSAPLPMTSALPMSVPPSVAPLGPPAAVLVPPAGVPGLSGPVPPPMNPASISAPASTMAARPQVSVANAGGAATAGAAPVKQQGSGHQMFQQMFALLKQMLPPEQYAALHSEMRNGNGNDIKSIVDIIKRIAGDAIFGSVIQKMDLTRNHSAAAGSLGIVKPEPSVVANPTPVQTMQRQVPMQRAPVAQSVPMPLSQPVAQMAAVAPPATATKPTPVTVQRPTLPAATPPIVSSIKPEPVVATSASPAPTASVAASSATTTPASATSTAPATGAATSSSGSSDNQEKIQFAKKLLFHASTCVLPSGICQVKRCDDVRRVFKHSVSCAGAQGCSHCKQLKALVEYHAKECAIPVGERCKIPFCDGIRQQNATARARAASVGRPTPTTTTPVVAASTTPSAVATPASTASAMSDDDEDNTPLASAVSKAKKSAKAKSPKASPGPSSTSGTSTIAAKKKTTPTSTAKAPAPAAAPAPSTGTPAAPAASANSATAKPKASSTQAQEYGRLLQLILHVEKCKTSTCAVGEECAEAKTLLRQVNSPDAPARAQTYKKVFAHYKVCVAKNNTQNCPMCRIGLMPLETGDSSTTTSATTTTTTSTSGTASSTTSTSVSVPASSPTVGTLKRTNSSLASPRSPNKKPRVTTKTGKTGSGDSAGASTPATAAAPASDLPSSDLAQANRNDLRKEEDVLTHTTIDLGNERRAMTNGSRRRAIPEQLACKKEEWQLNDLFNNDTLTRHMEALAKKHGVSIGSGPAAKTTTQIMAHALQEYMKQVMEEMLEAAKVRADSSAQVLDALVKKELGTVPRELTSTDILRVSCDQSFARLRQDDLALRSRLLEDAKRDELAEKERAKKRKKIDRVKQAAQEEKDEAEMDIEELAISDLKDKLLREDKDGVVHVDGRVNESIAAKAARQADDQVAMEDATYWLQNQKAYLHPKLFVRAEAARIATKALT